MAKQKRETNGLTEYSYTKDLNWYFNAGNIPNQDLVFATYDYFNEGERQGVFLPLDFLNLLQKQYDYLKECLNRPIDYLGHLKTIPLSDIQKHILLGFLLKWFGGYPVSEASGYNDSKQYETILRLIEREFLKFENDTPEKRVCQKDWIEYKRVREIEKMMNELLDSGQRPALSNENSEKIKWLAGPSYLGYLIDELDRNGYIDISKKTSNEKKAQLVLQVFNAETTLGTLAKELSEKNSLTPHSKDRIRIKPLKGN